MFRDIRLKLTMATRVRDFGHAHPAGATRFAETLARLDECLAQADALTDSHLMSRHDEEIGSATWTRLRRELLLGPLGDLARIARAASAEHPELRDRIVPPRGNANKQAFFTVSQVMLKEAARHRDLFVSYGMPETFVDDLMAALAEFEQAANAVGAGRAAHVGARRGLAKVTDEIMSLVNQLDAMYRIQFAHEVGLLASWRSARNVAWPTKKRRDAGEAAA